MRYIALVLSILILCLSCTSTEAFVSPSFSAQDVSVEEKLLSVSQVRFQGDLLLMKFSGYETPESARLLSGAILKVKREDARKLRKGEYYIADLYGLSVVFNGEKVGTVKDVSDGAQAPLLQVERNGKIFLVPNLPVFVSAPDFGKGEIELLMGDLLEL